MPKILPNQAYALASIVAASAAGYGFQQRLNHQRPLVGIEAQFMRSLGAPWIIGTAIIAPYTLVKHAQTLQQSVSINGTPIPYRNFPGLPATAAFLWLRLPGRLAAVPKATEVALEHRPEGLSVGATKALTAGVVSLAADTALAGQEHLMIAQQSFREASGEVPPSLANWWKASTSVPSFIKEVWRGTTAVWFRVAPFHVVTLGSRALADSFYNPTGKDTSKPTKDKVTMVSTAAATAGAVALTPLTGWHTAMARAHKPLTLRQAQRQMWQDMMTKGLAVGWKGFGPRAGLTAMTAYATNQILDWQGEVSARSAQDQKRWAQSTQRSSQSAVRGG